MEIIESAAIYSLMAPNLKWIGNKMHRLSAAQFEVVYLTV